MKIRGIAQATFFAVVSASCATAALADVKDKQPINYTVDGGTATGYFKVVAEALGLGLFFVLWRAARSAAPQPVPAAGG